ncbi:MAG: CotH kinase family protein, partial [Lachnospiraceae bacterium]|nr:CotH kinase family protein [Lachnospiraceae bacterium]
VIKEPTDADYDKDEFEKILEAKGSNDYSKLINMLDAFNDGDCDVEDFVEKYFDEDSIYTWMAFNILVDNKDADTGNFYLYSPTGSDKFYVIPWDYDGAFRYDYEKLRDEDYSPGWKKGVYIYNDSKLFSRMVRDEKCTNKLSERIAALHEGVLSGDNIHKKALELSRSVKSKLYSLPDMTYARVTEANYDMLIELLKNQADENYYAYYDSLETPAPFHIHEPGNKDGHVVISWDASDLLGGPVTYSLELSDSWDFTSKIKDETGIKETQMDVGELSEGQYFVRVKADTDKGLSQEAYEYYNTEQKTRVHGVMCFYVKADGSTVQSVYGTEGDKE